MSTAERRFADTHGDIMLAAKDDRPLADADWTRARILLSNRRLILATEETTEKLPLERIVEIGGRLDTSIDARQVSEYVQVQLPNRTYLIAATDHDRFEGALFRALLHGRTVDARHPAVEGGVVTDAEWESSSLSLDEEEIGVAFHSGRFVSLILDEVSGLDTDIRTIDGRERLVIAASHLDEEGTIVETQIAPGEPKADHLRTYLQRGMSVNRTNVDLSDTERAVLMALYAGMSPFDIPTFLDRDVEAVEAIYDRLVALELVEEIRRRREVRLNARGRNIANAVSETK